MATKKAREIRKAYKESGHIMVGSFARKYKQVFGDIKCYGDVPLKLPKGALPSSATHRTLVKQSEVTPVTFEVAPSEEDPSIMRVYRKSGKSLREYTSYLWTGQTLRYINLRDSILQGLPLPKSATPRLTHEQCCDIEKVLIRL